MGSGPSVYLASKRAVAGLILESGITSGIGVLLQNSKALRCIGRSVSKMVCVEDVHHHDIYLLLK